MEGVSLVGTELESTAFGQRFAGIVQQTGPNGVRTVVDDAELVVGGRDGHKAEEGQGCEKLHCLLVMSLTCFQV